MLNVRSVAIVRCLLLGLTCIIGVGASVSEVVLASSLNQEQVAYSGERVTFTCTTRGSLILEWYSIEYIGTGGQKLQLRSIDCLNNPETSPSNPNTIARCVSVTEENGVTVIVSELSITASSLYHYATVNCTNNGIGSKESITWRTFDQLELRSSLAGDSVSQPGERITFTCTTRGSHILEWYSNEYIGTGGQNLQLRSFDCLNNPKTSRSNPNTIARCVNVTEENGVTVIVSELSITASSLYPNAMVNCTNNGIGSEANITWRTFDKVELISSLSDDLVAFHEDRITFTCTTRGSLILEWYSNEYIGTGGQKLQLRSFDCLNNPETSPSNPNTIARCVSVTEENGVTMIVSELSTIASQWIPESSVMCGHNGSETEIITIQTHGDNYSTESIAPVTTTQATTPLLDNKSAGTGPGVVAAVTVPVIIVLLVVILMVVLLIVLCMKRRLKVIPLKSNNTDAKGGCDVEAAHSDLAKDAGNVSPGRIHDNSSPKPCDDIKVASPHLPTERTEESPKDEDAKASNNIESGHVSPTHPTAPELDDPATRAGCDVEAASSVHGSPAKEAGNIHRSQDSGSDDLNTSVSPVNVPDDTSLKSGDSENVSPVPDDTSSKSGDSENLSPCCDDSPEDCSHAESRSLDSGADHSDLDTSVGYGSGVHVEDGEQASEDGRSELSGYGSDDHEVANSDEKVEGICSPDENQLEPKQVSPGSFESAVHT